jgi:hypothetical protein
MLSKALSTFKRKPRIVVIGPMGRCGTGALNFARYKLQGSVFHDF